MMIKISLLILSFAWAFSAQAQINLVQSKAQGFPAGNFVSVELDAVPSEGNLLLAFLGAPSDSSNHFFPAESDWKFLADVISEGRLHVFYKYAGASESKTKTFLTPHVNSNYTAILAEYENAGSIVRFITSVTEDEESDSLHLGPVNAATGQTAVSAFVARQLNTDEIIWSDGFEARASVTADPEGSPLGSAMSDLTVTDGGEIQTTASWLPSALPSGIMFLLSGEEISYEVRLSILDEENDPLTGAIVTLNEVKNAAGEYTFPGIPCGTYDYKVEKENYLSVQGRITVIEDVTEEVTLYALTPGKYYVSADGDDSNPGNSPRAPWRTINKVLYHSFQTGDDVYFRCGDTFVPSGSWFVRWEGTAEDPAVIRAYYMEGEAAVHGVNEDGRPVICGSDYTVPENRCYGSVNSWRGLIEVSSKDYVHIKDIHIYKSGFYGINIVGNLNAGTNSAHFLIKNVKVEGSYSSAINIVNNAHNYGIIEDCDVSRACYGFGIKCESGWPGGIAVAHCPYSNTTIRRNYVYEVWGEGIILFTRPGPNNWHHGHVLVEDNILWNIRAVDIYVDGCEHVVVRRNLCLGAGPDVLNNQFFRSTVDGRGWNQFGININNEKLGDETGATSSIVNNIKVYNNLIANHRVGITLGSEHSVGARTMENIFFYNNTLIANRSNIYIGYSISKYTTSNVEVKNNISYSPPDDLSVDTSAEGVWWPAKVKWSNNSWTVPRPYAGSPGDVLTENTLVKTSGWQDLTEVISPESFALTEGSNAINAGINLSSFFTHDFFQHERSSEDKWDMGAIMADPSVQVESPAQGSGVLRVYPNPVKKGQINIEFNVHHTGNVRVSIFNVQGQEIKILTDHSMAPGLYSRHFDISGLSKGIYLIKLQTENRTRSEKIIITGE